MTYLVVGAGLSGAVISQQIATKLNEKVLIIEKLDHIGGNCYDYIDNETNILINKYGAHIFHTNNDKVWEYVNNFSEWIRWEHKVLSYVDNKYISVPINITSVNMLYNTNITNSNEMISYMNNIQCKYDIINNSEEMAKSRVGNFIYEKIFKDYTYKQWNKYPHELDSSVLARIPIYYDFDCRYFKDKYQALPKYGYTKFIENMINHPNINILMNTDYNIFKKDNDISKYKAIIFTGPIDLYFSNDLPKL